MPFLTDLRASRAPLASFAAMGVIWGSFAAMVPATKAMLGIGDAAWGSIFLVSSSAAVLSLILAPTIGPRLGRHAMPIATLMMAVAFALPGHLPEAAFFAIAMAGVGISSGLLDVLMNSRVSAIESERGLHLMNLNHGLYSFGYAGGALVTGLARSAGAGPAQMMTGAACCAALLALAAVERGAKPALAPRGTGRGGRVGLLPLIGGAVVLIAFLSENAVEAWSALHIERTLGGNAAEGALGPALLGLTMGIGRLSGHAVIARVAEAVLLRWSALVAACGAAVAALAPGPAIAYAGLVTLGAGVAVIAPTALAMVGRLAAPELRARAISRASALGYLGFFFGPPALGALSEAFGLRAAFGAVAVVLLLALPLVPALTRPR